MQTDAITVNNIVAEWKVETTTKLTIIFKDVIFEIVCNQKRLQITVETQHTLQFWCQNKCLLKYLTHSLFFAKVYFLEKVISKSNFRR